LRIAPVSRSLWAGEAELGFRLVRAPITAAVDPGNAASPRVAEKIGMHRCGEVLHEGYRHPDLVCEIR